MSLDDSVIGASLMKSTNLASLMQELRGAQLTEKKHFVTDKPEGGSYVGADL